MSEAVLDIGALESAAASVETSDTNVQDVSTDTSTPEVTPEVATEPEASTETETKPETEAKPETTDKATPVSNKAVIAQLQELKKTNAPLAEKIYSDLKYSQDAKRLLHELAPEAKSVAEAKEIIANRVSPETKEYIENVQQTDQLLYAGGESHAELSQNIVDDLVGELGEQQGKERFAELSTSLLSKLKETDPAAHTAIVRQTFLDVAESSGMIPALNLLAKALSEGSIAKSKAVMSDITKFFQSEIAAEQNVAKARTEAAAKRETQATAQRELQNTAVKESQSVTNRIIGNAFGDLLRGPLKSLDRPAQEAFALALQTTLNAELSKDADYQQVLKGVRSATTKTALLRKHEAVLKARAQDIVKQVAMQRHPALMKPAAAKVAAKPVAPPSRQVTIGGKSQTVFQLAKRPDVLLRQDTECGGRIYTTSDLELLQMAKGIGLVKGKGGKPVFVSWRRNG